MSKFNRLISTFRNGMLSPRLRGSIVEPADGSSAEVLENFLVDRTGSLVKRPGTVVKKITENSGYVQTFKLTFLNTDYLFTFDGTKTFTSVIPTSNISTWVSSGSTRPVRVFGTGDFVSPGVAFETNLWNGRSLSNGGYQSSGLQEYLNVTPLIYQHKKISDRTYVFTTNTFAFFISLLDAPSVNTYRRDFYIYPYFVDSVSLIQTLNKNTNDAVPCPISPVCFPFNVINTDTAQVITFSEWNNAPVAQNGSTIAGGKLAKSNDRIVWNIQVPQALHYLDSIPTYLTGRFIKATSRDALQDATFFITQKWAESLGYVFYYAIMVTGEAPASPAIASFSTSLWTLSSWGDENHPKVVDHHFGRLTFANTNSTPSQWWSSAIHPNRPFSFQGFMQRNLRQDSNSDYSGLNYQGATSPSSTDVFRFGFTNNAPSTGKIAWINSRKKVHYGTSNGECQTELSDGIYDRASYTMRKYGTNESSFGPSVFPKEEEGDRKIFYISNNFRDVRVISTEEKDYESTDVLATISIEGKGYYFTKIIWEESLSLMMCLAERPDIAKKKLYALSIHEDTQVKGMSEIIFDGMDIYDIYKGGVVLNNTTHIYHLDYTPFEYMDGTLVAPVKSIYSDFYGQYFVSAPAGDITLEEYMKNTTLYFYNGVREESHDTGSGTTLTPGELNFDLQAFLDESVFSYGQIYIYPKKISCKYKSTPIHEGAKFGSSVGDVQRVDRISVLVDNSGKFKYGAEEDKLIEAEGFEDSTFTNGLTSIVNIDLPQSPGKEQFVLIESDDPTPLNISGISLRGVSYSGE